MFVSFNIHWHCTACLDAAQCRRVAEDATRGMRAHRILLAYVFAFGQKTKYIVHTSQVMSSAQGLPADCSQTTSKCKAVDKAAAAGCTATAPWHRP